MLVHLLQKYSLTRRFVFWLGISRGRFIASLLNPWLTKKNKILDIGTGTGHVSLELTIQGYDVLPVDVVNLTFTSKVTPLLYDGVRLPFKAKEYDVALLLMVLHHIAEPEPVVKEAARVAKRIIVIEDVYDSRIHKYATFFFDSLFNLEFFGHPHTNRSDAQWQAYFESIGLKIVSVQFARSYGVFKHAIYVLEH